MVNAENHSNYTTSFTATYSVALSCYLISTTPFANKLARQSSWFGQKINKRFSDIQVLQTRVSPLHNHRLFVVSTYQILIVLCFKRDENHHNKLT